MIEDYLFDGGRPQELRLQLVSSTQTLLGDTIGLSDDEWQAPSRLPGWTRAHLASHLAQEANRVLAVSERLQRGVRPLSWAISEPDRELEAASRRSAVALQVALDTSASQLLTSLD
ncbi:MAG: maleylpyruvate isomerase family mycothiol-dependent enzyme, partial [Propionibacteriaceae bacterium]|nr:maleylpyruvate isomerase family mycothiol-dependent enzyme [Propionibacteriaceae bacterium]